MATYCDSCETVEDAVPNISNVTCLDKFGVPYRVIFTRLYDPLDPSVLTERNLVDSETESLWTARLALETFEKIVCSPEFDEPNNEGGSPITYGGGDQLRDRAIINMGHEATSLKAKFTSIPQSVVTEMKKYVCLAESRNLGIYMVNQSGAIYGDYDSTNDKFRPFPLTGASLSPLMFGTASTPNYNDMTLTLPEGWSDRAYMLGVDFGRKLKNPAS